MTETLTFFTNPMSRGQIVRWMLEETGVPYDTEIIEYGPPMQSPEYLAINPMAKVPAIRHGDRIVTECAAICAYLADAFPDAGLAPPVSQRADYYRWLFFGAGPVEHAISNNALGFKVNEEQSRMAGYGDFERTMSVLESAVAGRSFIVGDTFTAADVYVGSHITWGLQFNTIPQRPAFTAYAEGLKRREAWQRANNQPA